MEDSDRRHCEEEKNSGMMMTESRRENRLVFGAGFPGKETGTCL